MHAQQHVLRTHKQSFFFIFLFFRHKHTVWHTEVWVCSGGAVASHTHESQVAKKKGKKRAQNSQKKKNKGEKKELAEIKRWPKEKIKHNNAVDSLCSTSWSKKRRKKNKVKKKSMSIYSDNIEESGYSIQKNERGKPACKSRRKQEKKSVWTQLFLLDTSSWWLIFFLLIV